MGGRMLHARMQPPAMQQLSRCCTSLRGDEFSALHTAQGPAAAAVHTGPATHAVPHAPRPRAEGVIEATKDFNLKRHSEELDVPNLEVIKLMQSFTSLEYVTERFAWRHYYWCVQVALAPGRGCMRAHWPRAAAAWPHAHGTAAAPTAARLPRAAAGS